MEEVCLVRLEWLEMEEVGFGSTKMDGEKICRTWFCWVTYDRFSKRDQEKESRRKKKTRTSLDKVTTLSHLVKIFKDEKNPEKLTLMMKPQHP
jgi:hypothetical protein